MLLIWKHLMVVKFMVKGSLAFKCVALCECMFYTVCMAT